MPRPTSARKARSGRAWWPWGTNGPTARRRSRRPADRPGRHPLADPQFRRAAAGDFTAASPLRDEFVGVVRMCLDRQVGVHFLDEADLWRSQLVGGELRLGKARYSRVLLAACPVVHANTLAKLRVAAEAGVRVMRIGPGPQWQETKTSVEPARLDWCAGGDAATVVRQLPRLVDLKPDGADIRCTAWQRDNRSVRLLDELAQYARRHDRRRKAIGTHARRDLSVGRPSCRPDKRVKSPGRDGRERWRVEGEAGRLPRDARRSGYQSTRSVLRLRRFCRLGFADQAQRRRLAGWFYAGYWHASPPTPLRYSAKTIEEYRKIGLPADIVAPTGGRAMMIRSTDEGKTWSKPATLIDTPADDRHPGWVELPDGRLLCSLFTYPGAELGDIIKRPENAYRTGILRSFDHGKTWEQQPIRPPSPFLADESDGPMVLLKDGSILLTIDGAPKEGGPSTGGRLHEPRPRGDVAAPVHHQGRPRPGRGKRHAVAGRPAGHDGASRGGHLLVS